MTEINHIRTGSIVTGPTLPEPVEVLVTMPMGSALKIIGRGRNTGMTYDPVLTPAQIAQLQVSAEREPFDGDARLFRLGIEAQRLGLAYEYDPFFSLSIARVDPLPHQLEAVYGYFLRLFGVETLPDGRMTVREPTYLHAITPAPQGTPAPDGAMPLPHRQLVEQFLYEYALQPWGERAAAERAAEVVRVAKHVEISLNALIDHQNIQLGEYLNRQVQGQTVPGLDGLISQAEQHLDELNNRLETRRRELELEGHSAVADITHLGRAWVLPHPERTSPQLAPMIRDDDIEKIAVQEAIRHEEARGWVVESVETENRGFDLISHKFDLPGKKDGIWYVYAVRCKDETLYIGQTDDLANRWHQHCTGQGAQWTAAHGVKYVAYFEETHSLQEAVALEKKWKSGSGREWLKAKTRDVHLPAGRQVEVRFIEVKGRAGVGVVALSENEYRTAERLKNDYWLYAVFNCLPACRTGRCRDTGTSCRKKPGAFGLATRDDGRALPDRTRPIDSQRGHDIVSDADSPQIVMLAGPNGAGKSTCASELLRGTLGVTEFVNADTIAQGLSAFHSQSVALYAGRIMLRRLQELAEQRTSFAFETTLASRTFAPWLTALIASGYRFHLVFLWLPSADFAVDRVDSKGR